MVKTFWDCKSPFYIPKVLGEYLLDDGGLSQKNMSFCYQTSAADFLKYLDNKQYIKYSARFSCMYGRFNYKQGDFSTAKESLKISLKYGDIELRTKSAWMLLMSFLKKINYYIYFPIPSLWCILIYIRFVVRPYVASGFIVEDCNIPL